MDNWISIDKKLPKTRRWVIGASENGIFVYSMFQYSRGKWTDYEGREEGRIRFWMPTPSPPEK